MKCFALAAANIDVDQGCGKQAFAKQGVVDEPAKVDSGFARKNLLLQGYIGDDAACKCFGHCEIKTDQHAILAIARADTGHPHLGTAAWDKIEAVDTAGNVQV